MHVLFRAAVRFSLWAAPVACAALAVRPVCAQFSFTPASELPGGGFHGTPTAISGDGSTVIGNLPITMGREGFRWNAESGMIRLGDLPDGNFNSTADDVSYDGSIVVGSSSYRNVLSNGALFRGWQPYRWSRDSGMVGLGIEGLASAVSADGSVVVGFNDFGSIRWTLAEGASYVIGPSPFPNYRSGATDVSADGTTVVGWTWGSTGQSQAFRWTQSAGVASLDPANYAYHISGDGRVVIGYNRSTRALRWTQEDGWTAFGHAELYAGEISADGSTIVGLDGSGSVSQAFFWTSSSGVVNLQDYLLANGIVEAQDWTLKSAIDVSADGRTIVGVGINPQGQTEAWVATIPEPSTVVLVIVAIGTLTVLSSLTLNLKRSLLASASILCGLLAANPVFAQFTFTPASELPGGGFPGTPYAISGDGSTIVGVDVQGNRREAFRWTAANGTESLGDLSGGGFLSGARDVSADGSVVVGYGTDGNGLWGGIQAMRWTASSGMKALTIFGGEFSSSALATSADGSVVVGHNSSEGFRWTAAGGPEAMQGSPSDVSADGTVVVGITNTSGVFQSFRWTAADGMAVLNDRASIAYSVSGDGSVVVGLDQAAQEAFRYNATSGWQLLGRLPGTSSSIALATSHDGSVIVGNSDSTAGDAFLWTASFGMMNLRDYLVSQGVTELQDRTLGRAIDISADGRTILGIGTNPLGQTEAWVVTLPEPSTLVLLAAGLAGVAALRTRWRTFRTCLFLLSALASLALDRPVVAQYSFTSASDLPGGGFHGTPAAISGDGTTIVGWTDSPGGNEAFRYNADSGMVLLGDLPGGRFESRANAVSHDGSIVLGTSSFQIAYGTGSAPVSQPFQWSVEQGMTGIGFAADAASISADGSLVVGGTNSGVFRWSSGEGPVYVFLPSRNHFLAPSDTSADGNTIVGWSRSLSGQFEAFRWTADRGVTLLGPGSYASDVSGDGHVVIGSHGSAGGSRWTEQAGWTPLGHPQTDALGINADGSVIVGSDRSTGDYSAYFWTESSSIANLREFLLAGGIDEARDWNLLAAIDVSADGRTIVGIGDNPQGQREAWVATIPEPSTFILFAASLFAIATYRISSRRCVRHSLLFTIALLAFAVARPVSAQYSFTPASELRGGGFRGHAVAISGDGSTVVGWPHFREGAEALRWNAEIGTVPLGVLHDTDSSSRARGVSFDGSVVVGDSSERVPPGTTGGRNAEAFRWTAETGMIRLGLLPGANLSTASATSANGSVIAGVSGRYSQYSSSLQAFRWTPDDGIVELDRPPDNPISGVSGISSDGNTIVGWVSGRSSDPQPVRWSAEGRIDLVGSSSNPDGVSADGKVVIGWVNGAARWTEQEGWVSLGDPTANADAINGDGSVIVGSYISDGARGLFFWTPTAGIINLRQHLLDQGLTRVQDWTLEEAIDISDDGRTILGYGINPRGETEAWIATIPEPSTFTIAGVALLIFAAVRIAWINHAAQARAYHTTSRPSDSPW